MWELMVGQRRKVGRVSVIIGDNLRRSRAETKSNKTIEKSDEGSAGYKLPVDSTQKRKRKFFEWEYGIIRKRRRYKGSKAIQRKAAHVRMGRSRLKLLKPRKKVQFQVKSHVYCMRKEHILNIQTIFDTL